MWFRDGELRDAPLLLDWRNDPLTRRMAGVSVRAGRWEYAEWLAASLADPAREIQIAMLGRTPVGMIRCDQWADATELVWTVAPEWRGQGIGKRMVRDQCRRRPGRLRARIRTINEASKKIALLAGMHYAETQGGIEVYERRPQFDRTVDRETLERQSMA